MRDQSTLFGLKFIQMATAASLLATFAPVLSVAHAQGMNMPGMEKKDMSKSVAAKTASGTGTVTAIDASGRRVTLEHGPIPELKWPAMKMQFGVDGAVDLSKVKAGDKVRFTMTSSGGKNTIQSMAPSP